MVAGDKRRSTEGLTIVGLDYIRKNCEKAKNTRDKCLVAMLYLSGRRINEILFLKKVNVKVRELTIEFETRILKKKEKPRVNIKMFRHSPSGMKLCHYITDHLETLEMENYLYSNKRGGHITRGRAWQILTEIDPDTWCHWFRHQRASDIAKKTKDPLLPFLLRAFFNWSSLDPAIKYVHGVRMEEVISEI